MKKMLKNQKKNNYDKFMENLKNLLKDEMIDLDQNLDSESKVFEIIKRIEKNYDCLKKNFENLKDKHNEFKINSEMNEAYLMNKLKIRNQMIPSSQKESLSLESPVQSRSKSFEESLINVSSIHQEFYRVNISELQLFDNKKNEKLLDLNKNIEKNNEKYESNELIYLKNQLEESSKKYEELEEKYKKLKETSQISSFLDFKDEKTESKNSLILGMLSSEESSIKSSFFIKNPIISTKTNFNDLSNNIKLLHANILRNHQKFSENIFGMIENFHKKFDQILAEIKLMKQQKQTDKIQSLEII